MISIGQVYFISFLIYISLCCIARSQWKTHYEEQFKDDLFQLRRDTFEMVLENSSYIWFDHKLYRTFERKINMTLRYSETSTAISILLSFVFLEISGISLQNSVEVEKETAEQQELLAKYPEKIRMHFSAAMEKYEYILLSYLIGTSTLVASYFLTTGIMIFFNKLHSFGTKSSKSATRKAVRFIQTDMEFEGKFYCSPI